jgi:environmental stress-induced protein Ves
MARIIRAADCRRMRWKNGGGETAEIAVFPAGSRLDEFDWRISMAQVEADGPFSTFPDVDRTLAILEGEGISLDIEGRGVFGLTARSDPLSFPADAPTNAKLITGPITDLNVMTRRGKAVHALTRLHLNGREEFRAGAATALIFCQSGKPRIEAEGQEVVLGRFDSLLIEGHGVQISLAAEQAVLMLVEID